MIRDRVTPEKDLGHSDVKDGQNQGMLDEDEALLEEIALDMEPEDGRLYIYDLDDDVPFSYLSRAQVWFCSSRIF